MEGAWANCGSRICLGSWGKNYEFCYEKVGGESKVWWSLMFCLFKAVKVFRCRKGNGSLWWYRFITRKTKILWLVHHEENSKYCMFPAIDRFSAGEPI